MPLIPSSAPCATCGGGGGGAGTAGIHDVEPILLCDKLVATGEVVGVALAVWDYDNTTGLPTGPPTFVDPETGAPYVPVGTLLPCDEDGRDVENFILCDIQPDNSSVTFVRSYLYHTDAGGFTPPANDTLLDGTPYVPTGVVGTCEPHTFCTPEPNVDLNADCGPGENINVDIPADAGDSPNHVINQDPTADPLCGGTWNRPEEAQAAPFPVAESFRNGTLDELPANTGGTPPYFQLTSGGIDPAGAGWGRMSDQNSVTNGFWQVGTPFPSANGVTAEATFASYGGTTPGGDGFTFTFTDGSAPAQVAAVGGGGSLGVGNWSGGYLSVNFDMYGGTGFDTGLGFAPNSITITRAGAGYGPGGGLIAVPVGPHQLNSLPRNAPARLRASIIVQGGVPYVSAAIDWNDGNGFIQYVDRFDASAAGPVPATMRMGANGASGGALTSIKEIRDAEANAIGLQQWRAFPITTDAIPACVTLVNVSASVDVTFASAGGDNTDPDAYFYLVNTATNTILASDRVSALNAQLGTAQTLEVAASVAPADVPNLRIYVGQDTRDDSGAYGATWDNLDIEASGAGCPALPVRTLAISAPCPIPVIIVGGGTDGGDGGGTTIFNAPSTFEDVEVCATVGGVQQAAFRREVRDAAGNITVEFLGANGIPVTPDSWYPGSCNAFYDVEHQVLCDFGNLDVDGNPFQFSRSYRYQAWNASPPLAPLQIADTTLDNLLAYIPVGPVGLCGDTSAEDQLIALGEFCYSDGGPVVRRAVTVLNVTDNSVTYYDVNTGLAVVAPLVVICEETFNEFQLLCDLNILTGVNTPFLRQYVTQGGTVGFADLELDGTTPYVTTGQFQVDCSQTTISSDAIILCDAGNANHQFVREYKNYDQFGNPPIVPFNIVDMELDGATPYALVGPAVLCPVTATIAPGRDVEQEVLCDNNGAFVRRYEYNDQSGLPSGVPSDFTLAGAPYVTVGPVINCAATVVTAQEDDEFLILCSSTPVAGTQFLRRYRLDAESGAVIGIVNTTLDGVTPFAPGVVSVCAQTIVTDTDFVQEVLCDSVGSFIRRFTFNSVTGAVIAVTNLTLAGAAYVPVGTVGSCEACCPIEIGRGCTNVGSLRYTALRLSNGTISLIDSVTGAAVLPANVVACADDNTVLTLNSQHFDVLPGTPWTTALVVGTGTALTYTVVSGTATVTDQNGTVIAGIPAGFSASWNAEDNNTLLMPNSIAADAASRVIVHWTQR